MKRSKILELTRALRQQMTPAETVFWNAVRRRQIGGKKILRQHPIRFQYYNSWRFYVADFFCAENNLVIEIDGGVHADKYEQDEVRTEMMRTLKGIKVIRFSNDEVMREMDSVMDRLRKALAS